MTKTLAEFIKEELPAFDVREEPRQDIVAVQGMILLGYRVTAEQYTRFRSFHEEEGNRLFAKRIADETRKGAIEGLNMEPMIRAREAAAEARGRAQGREEGYRSGQTVGYQAAVKAMEERLTAVLKEDDE